MARCADANIPPGLAALLGLAFAGVTIIGELKRHVRDHTWRLRTVRSLQERYLLVASKGGAPEHPSWYLNLTEHPEVEVQVGADKFAARARTADAPEKPRLWQVMASIWPDYEGYQKNTGRDIQVVIVERI